MEAPTAGTTGSKKSSVPFQRDQLLRVFEILGTPNREHFVLGRAASETALQRKLGLRSLNYQNTLEWSSSAGTSSSLLSATALTLIVAT